MAIEAKNPARQPSKLESQPEVCIILPVYNGARYLENTINKIEEELGKGKWRNYEVIIAEDGGEDGTSMVAAGLGKKVNVRVISSRIRRGKGDAIERAVAASRAERIVYFDSDLATKLDRLGETIGRLGDYDIVIGSRYMEGAVAKRRKLRGLLSHCYLGLVNVVFGAKISDYQCGFKGFRKSVADEIFPTVVDKKWFWDTEVILQSISKGKKIWEVPVVWVEANDSTLDIMKDTYAMFVALLRYRISASGFFSDYAKNAGAKRQGNPGQDEAQLKAGQE